MYWIKKFFSNLNVHGRAFSEVFCVCLFSLGPLGVNLFVQYAKSDNVTGTFVSALDSLFGRGQMYLMAYALFGTIFWLAFLRPDRDRHNARVVLGLVATICMFPIVGFIGIDPTFSTVANPEIVTIGYYFYAGFAVIYYLLLFYMEIQPPSPADIFESETADLLNEYGKLTR